MHHKKINTVMILAITVFLGLILVMSGCSGQQAAEGEKKNEIDKSGAAATGAQKILLKYGEINPDGHPITEGAKEFARLVKEKSNGRIEIQVYPAGQLGDEKVEIQTVQMGGLDFFRANSNTLPDFGADKMSVLALPFIFKSRDHMHKVLNGPVGEEILKQVEEKDLKMVALTFYDDGARHFFLKNKPAKEVSDLKGLKIRVPQNQILMDMVKAFGASPTPISYGELYSALQTGVVDGAENTIAGYLTNSFFEVGKYPS